MRDSTIFLVLGFLLLLLAAAASIHGVEHPELFEDSPIVGLIAIAIGLHERRRNAKL